MDSVSQPQLSEFAAVERTSNRGDATASYRCDLLWTTPTNGNDHCRTLSTAIYEFEVRFKTQAPQYAKGVTG